jgi:hypothetical protein
MRDLRTELKKIEGTGFAKDVDSLVDLAHATGPMGTNVIYNNTMLILAAIGSLSTAGVKYIINLLHRAKIIFMDKSVKGNQ